MNLRERGLLVRAIIYGTLIAWLVGDFVIFQGPLSQWIRKRGLTPEDLPANVVAVAGRRAILESDLQEAVHIYLFRRGQSISNVSPERLHELRRIVLSSLIQDKLIAYRADQIPVDIDPEDWQHLAERYEDEIASDPTFEKRLRRELHELRWIEDKTAEWRVISDSEVLRWQERWGDRLKSPSTKPSALSEEIRAHLRNQKTSSGAEALVNKLRETSDITIAWDKL